MQEFSMGLRWQCCHLGLPVLMIISEALSINTEQKSFSKYCREKKQGPFPKKYSPFIIILRQKMSNIYNAPKDESMKMMAIDISVFICDFD